MNSTTWIIEPNGFAWVLLSVATISLLGIAIRLWTQRQSASPATNNRGEVVAWMALVVSIISVVCVFFKTSDPNNASMLITALGVIVTLLVTWQIFSLINLNRFESRIRETDNNLHRNIGEICGDISASQAGIDTMAHVALLFTIHALIHYSQIGDFEQCEREISALVDDSHIISSNDAELRAMYHRMTGRIIHTERIRNFDRLVEYINSLFTQSIPPTPSN